MIDAGWHRVSAADSPALRPLLRRLRYVLLGYAVTLPIAAVGYRLLEGWRYIDGLWMVVITFTTIGYGEVHPLSDGGRLFTLGLIVTGLVLHTYTLSQITRYLVDGGLLADIRARRRRRIMEELSGHVIVVGLGRLGMEVAELLHADGERVVAIDTDEARLEACRYAALRILGDGSSDEVLTSAGIARARAVAVATGSSAVNVFVVLSARQLNPELHILTRVDEHEASSKALIAGADGVLSPYRIGGIRMAHAITHPHAARFIEQAEGREFPDLWIRDVPITEGSGCCGRLVELKLPARFGVMVVAVRRPGGELVSPPGPEVWLRPGDVAVVAGRPEAIQAFADQVGA